MAIADDISIDRDTGNIRYTGSTANYTLLEFHRFVGDLSDDASSAGDDEHDITDDTVCVRYTDEVFALQGAYNIDDTLAQHLYGGSVTQDSGDEMYSGLRVIGSTRLGTTQLQLVQNNGLLTNYWGTGINDDDPGTLLRLLVKTRTGGADIDGKRLRVQARELGDTFSFFELTLGQGEAVAAIQTVQDDFNQTAAGTISGWTDITNTEGYQLIDLNNGNGDRPYYHQWDIGSRTLNNLYERCKWIARRGTSETIHGMNAELFIGITHSFTYTGESGGPFQEDETLSWGTGATAGTGILLALLDEGTTGTLYIQRLTGAAPVAALTVTGGTSSATATIGTVTARTVPAVFVGTYTGSISTAYGVGIDPNDVGSSDVLRDLTDTAQSPPNNQTFTVSGLVSGEDRVLVAPEDGAGGIDFDQLSADTGNTSGSGTLVVKESIPADTPASGTVRAWNGSSYDRLPYDSWTGSTFTLTGTLPNTIAEDADCWVSYIDVAASATTAAFTAIYSSDRTLIVRVRDGGSTPIKPFESTATFGSGGGSINAIRTTDA